MKCRHVQRWLDDFTDGRVPAAQADEMRRHLAECTDCRVRSQRTARLQRLVALKRYEQPPPEYFANVVHEFHRRLAAVTQQPTWRDRVAAWWDEWTAAGWPVTRLALAGAATALIVAGVTISLQQRRAASPAVAVRPAGATNQPAAVVAVVPVVSPTPQPRLTVATAPAPVVTVSEAAPLFVPPAARAGERAPRYVLDRLAITPASYEGPNIQF